MLTLRAEADSTFERRQPEMTTQKLVWGTTADELSSRVTELRASDEVKV